MKILFVGTFQNKWSTHHGMVKAFEEIGHEVIKFDFRKTPKILSFIKNTLYQEKFRKYLLSFIRLRPYLPNPIKSLKYYLFGNGQMNYLLEKKVQEKDYDLVFFAKADLVNPKTIKKVTKQTKTWYYFMDPLKTAYQLDIKKYAINSTWSSATFSNVTRYFKKYGATSFFITQGIDPIFFSPGKENKNKEIDVIFVGTRTSKREKYVRFLRNHQISIVCFGVGWENKPIFRSELVKQYRKSKIILNFIRGEIGFYLRVFQVLGTGSFLLSEYSSDLKRIFDKTKHLDWFRNQEELLELIHYYLDNEQKREEIAKNGRKFIEDNYTWEDVIKKIMSVINFIPNSKKES